MGYVLPTNKYPLCLRGYKEITGIYVGGCIRGRDSRFYRSEDNKRIALAHSHPRGKYRGWLCVPFKTRLRTRNLMLHELAHILCGAAGIKRGHNRHWRWTMCKLGGVLYPYELVGSTLSSKDHRRFIDKILDGLLSSI